MLFSETIQVICFICQMDCPDGEFFMPLATPTDASIKKHELSIAHYRKLCVDYVNLLKLMALYKSLPL